MKGDVMSGGSHSLPQERPAPVVERHDQQTEVTVSRAARSAAVWLIGVGVLLVGAFGWGFVERFREGFEGGFDSMDGIIVVVFSTAAIAHIAAGLGVWRGHRWGALLGIVFAAIGLLFCVLASLEAWFMLLPVACYVGTLVILAQASLAWRPKPSAE